MMLAEFIHWYYYKVPLAIVEIWLHFLVFFFSFFGISYHLATFFRPWRLVSVQFEEPSAIQRFFFNLAGRVIGVGVGMITRSLAIAAGLIAIVIVFFGGIVVEFMWLSMPALLLFVFTQGISFLL